MIAGASLIVGPPRTNEPSAIDNQGVALLVKETQDEVVEDRRAKRQSMQQMLPLNSFYNWPFELDHLRVQPSIAPGAGN
jgi:hypothetical protein